MGIRIKAGMEGLRIPFEFIKAAKLSLAIALVELASWDAGSIPSSFEMEYEGADWEVVVRIKPTGDGAPPSGSDRDFIEQLPE